MNKRLNNLWIEMFRPRTKKWLKSKRAELNRGANKLETEEQREAKLEAVNILLNKK